MPPCSNDRRSGHGSFLRPRRVSKRTKRNIVPRRQQVYYIIILPPPPPLAVIFLTRTVSYNSVRGHKTATAVTVFYADAVREKLPPKYGTVTTYFVVDGNNITIIWKFRCRPSVFGATKYNTRCSRGVTPSVTGLCGPRSDDDDDRRRWCVCCSSLPNLFLCASSTPPLLRSIKIKQ